MKKSIVTAIIFLFLFLGCDFEKKHVSYQASSKGEAIYRSQSLGFDENLIYISVSSVMLEKLLIFNYPVTPRVAETSDSSLAGKKFVHILVSKDKDGKLWLVFLNDTRPPEIVFKKKLN